MMNDPDTYHPDDEWQETAPPKMPRRWTIEGWFGGMAWATTNVDLNDMMCDRCGGEAHDRSRGGDCSEDVKQVVKDIRKPLTFS